VTRGLPIAFLGLIGLLFVQCGPSASGTKTNWFRECDGDADCGEELSCTCGTCTLPCTADAECEEGRCSTELESSVQCGMATAERICVSADVSTCSEFTLEADTELGDAIAPSCDQSGALVCESFDRPFPAEYSTWLDEAMSAAIQDCEVFAGDGALHYESTAAGQSQTRIRLPAPVSSGPLHARFFVRLPAATVLPEQLQLLELWETDGTSVPGRVAVFLGADGVPRVYVGASDTTLSPSSAEPLARDTWACLELVLDVQADSGSASLSVDGAEVLSGSGFSTQPAEPISVVVVEGQPTTDTVGVALYLDELVVATDPIGCE